MNKTSFVKDPASGRIKPDITKIHLIPVPPVRQATDYTCGVACVCSILRYAGYEFDVRQDELSEVLQAYPENGTSYHNIVKYLEEVSFSDTDPVNAEDTDGQPPVKTEVVHRGEKVFEVETKTGCSTDYLKNEIAAGNPCIICIQAWDYLDDYSEEYDSGHYVIACGYDEENMYFMDPSTLGTYAYIPVDEFMDRWHDMDGEGEKVDNFVMSIRVKGNYEPDAFYKIR